MRPLQLGKVYSLLLPTVTSTALKKQKQRDLGFKGNYKSKLMMLGLAYPASH